MTPSEKYVFELCKKSFLPFWSFPNPLGKKGNELCDLLIVCQSYVVIISVKENKVSSEPNNQDFIRWYRKAIDKSVRQIYGAEKYLNQVEEVILSDKKTKVKLPHKEHRKVFRIAMTFGAEGKYPYPTGEMGNGFVHVFDKYTTNLVLDELNTVTDFINYLEAKEDLSKKTRLLVEREHDLLATYIQTGFQFDEILDTLAIAPYTWEAYFTSEEYSHWKYQEESSFIWDIMVRTVYDFHIKGDNSNSRFNELENVLRYINLETRAERIELGNAIEEAIKVGVKARMIKPLPGRDHCYVFMPLTQENWNRKEDELQMRCHVARVETPESKRVIGIGVGADEKGMIWFDIAYLEQEELIKEFIEISNELKNELGLFKNLHMGRNSKSRSDSKDWT